MALGSKLSILDFIQNVLNTIDKQARLRIVIFLNIRPPLKIFIGFVCNNYHAPRKLKNMSGAAD
jgi:hypothetical protein